MLGARFGDVDVGTLGELVDLLVLGAPLRLVSLGGGVSLQVPEEDVGGVGRKHREVVVLFLEDRGASRPAPGVADVV